MKIYTRTGDKGTTALYGGERRSKGDIRIEAYGQVDELQAQLGVVVAEIQKSDLADVATLTKLLEDIQRDAFILCCELARTETKPERKDPIITAERIVHLEEIIDTYDAKLPKLTSFIMQGGALAGAQLHLARTVCRRAERAVANLSEEEDFNPDVTRYLNRLSDLLFVFARFVNQSLGRKETELKFLK